VSPLDDPDEHMSNNATPCADAGPPARSAASTGLSGISILKNRAVCHISYIAIVKIGISY